MVTHLYYLLKEARPRQWLKNISVAAALVFSRTLFVPEKFWLTVLAVIVFCLISSSIYYINDIADRKTDRAHPYKKFRPIAAGKISVQEAILVATILMALGSWIAYGLNPFFFLLVISYVLLQLLYSFALKHLAIIDMLTIAGGFIMRVYAGAMVIDAHLTIWFLLCVVCVALLISVGKRRAELSILDAQHASEHRKVLSKYPPDLLNSYVSMFANAAFLSWALFTYYEPTRPAINHAYPGLFDDLPLTFSGVNKWLMATIPVVIYGIMRYMRIIYDGSKAESPERVLLADKPLLGTAVVWALMIIFILYMLPERAY